MLQHMDKRKLSHVTKLMRLNKTPNESNKTKYFFHKNKLYYFFKITNSTMHLFDLILTDFLNDF